jgi:flavin-dependent dehydrogenase
MNRPDAWQAADPVTDLNYEVGIGGAGLGGMGAAIFLRQAGVRVVCIEPEPFPHARVGESFDWSTPSLLNALGLPRDQLIAENIGIYKKKIRLFPLGRPEFDGGPHEWFQKPPLGFEVTTLHADRVAMDQKLFERAQSLGVEFIWDRVAAVETEGERVVALRTAQGRRVSAAWFVDASGQARVFAKAFGIPKVDYGRRKVCLWTYFATETHYEGTSFYGDDMGEYLSWTWEIPINASTISVGWVMPAEALQARRRTGKPVSELLREELAKYPRFEKLLAEQPDTPVRTTSYRCYVNRRVCGPNWVMVGEAASLPDPLTGNGVTAAFRHAKDASSFIVESLTQGALTHEQMLVYDTNVRRMGHAFNLSIELCAYNPIMRWGVGSLVAMTVYTGFGYLINALYNKFNPQTPRQVARFNWLFRLNEVWMRGWELLARAILQVRRPRAAARGTKANAT